MSKEIYISSTPHETRLAIVENDALAEMYYERENEYTLAGSIYNGKVTRVLPGMQSSFVDIGLERDAFLYITDFMEEAGDAADFEANANAGDSRRAPRESRSDRSSESNGDRAPRSERSVPAEPTDSELFTDAVASLDPACPASDRSGDRTGDRSRRGGRNRRDRNLNSDGTPRRDRSPDRGPERSPDRSPDRTPDRSPSIRTDAPPPPPPPQPIIESHPDAELGEGAPGADGSRRWRGRRGRRGSRGGETTGVGEAPAQAQPAEPAQATGPVSDAYPAAYGSDEASLTLDPPVEAAHIAPSNTEARAPREDRGGRNDRSRRDRSQSQERGQDRSQERGQGLSQDRGRDRNGERPAPRAPRGFAPSASLYQVDGAADPRPYGQEEELAAPTEPIILPGESLGKYRPASETTSLATPAPTPPPAQEFVAAGWDGGFVLPGETIRPRTPSTSPEPSRSDRNDRGGRDSRGRDRNRDSRGGRDSGSGRDSSGGRDSRGPRPQTFAAPAPSAPEPEELTTPPFNAVVETEESDSHPAPTLSSTFVPPPPMPEPVAELSPEQEYEPSEASASYRIDPVPPSQYVQAAPELEHAAPASDAPDLPEPRHTITEFLEHEAEAFNPEIHTPETMNPEARTPEIHTPEPAPETHDITSILATGDMYSEAPQLTSQELTAPSEALQGPPASSVELPADAIAADQTAPYFAPGAGLLEEEELFEEDEEAGPIPTLNAHSGDEPHEQETLEGAADLGSMLREMSIDQITRTEPALDEDDEEDDFLEEDQDYEESERGRRRRT